jgi:2-keto-3-deoxy-L-rhamnonate aldolase RhmA
MLTEKLQKREKIFATSLVSIQWSGVVEIFANDVLDILIIDLEHGSFSPEAVENLIRNARARKLPVIVRAADTLYHLLSSCLDAGAAGVLVPRVENADRAQQALQSIRFPPLGRKGFGGFPLVNHWQGVDAFNDQTVVLMQIESQRGIDNLEEILSLKGISGILVGPSDLSIDLGIPLQYEHPRLVEAIDRVLTCCDRHQRSCGIYCPTVEMIAFWRARGMNIFWSGCAADFIAQSYERLCRFVAELD